MKNFRKSRRDATLADYEMEAAGLRWLAEADGIRVPEILGVGGEPGWLELEPIDPGPLTDVGAEELGRALAAMHALGAPSHGALPPGAPDRGLRLGLAKVVVAPADSWAQFYAGQLVSPLARRAHETGNLTSEDLAAIVAVGERIDELAGPEEPPA
ncbi:MAG: fructosamine kinase family protein, partial [Solirubrobacterales bacterium]